MAIRYESLIDVADRFQTEQDCLEALESLRWPKGVKSPYYYDSPVYVCKNGYYKCGISGKYFSAKTDTIFEGTKVPLRKWFLALALMATDKKSLSSHELGRQIGVSQPTAWYMQTRIRSILHYANKEHLGGNVVMTGVEADEVYLTPRTRPRHVHYRGKAHVTSNRYIVKPEIKVFTMVETDGSKLNMQVVPNCAKSTIYPIIQTYVARGSHITTDDSNIYDRVTELGYSHTSVCHSTFKYVDVDGNNTNRAENAHRHLRAFLVAHNHTSCIKNMQSYIDDMFSATIQEGFLTI